MDFVDTFEMRFPGMSHAAVAAAHPSDWGVRTPPSGSTAADDPLLPFVDGSRWLVRCSNPVCGGAERVNFTTGVMFCCSCRNSHVGHAFLRVRLPSPKQRRQIEEALLKRPDWRYRAWFPGETVKDLDAQNVLRGIV